ncbi:hypothetical protein [Salipiger abyssi]|uniref:DUF2059 domain-containing protein n=1 Tax=Salipiger abyssi TaxID=1250539 RepID=A0A1P8UR51_9RHOB|nr:hypothetical protein [Salipiger abyssi]APZ51894.1 hypothetical protein Ga0080574_TMP1560 [Salipiger abyssi]
MKRLLTATALSTIVATSAFAASEAEMNAITTYYPDANFEALTDDQVTEMFAVANSGVSDTEKRSQIEDIAQADNPSASVAVEEELQVYIPEWRLDEMSSAERERVVALVSESEDPAETRVQIVDSMKDAAPNLTTGEVSALEELVPEADYSVLTTGQVDDLRAALYGDSSDSEKKSDIERIMS